MAWWDNTEEFFKSWLADLINTSASLAVTQQSVFGGNPLEQAYNDAVKTSEEKTKPLNELSGRVSKILEEQRRTRPNANASGTTTAASPAPTPGTGGTEVQKDVAGLKANVQTRTADMLRQQQGSINGVDPRAPVWDSTKKKTFQMGDPKEFAPKGSLTYDSTRTLGETVMDPYEWEPEKLKKVAGMMRDAGYLGPNEMADRMKIADIWSRLAATSALMYGKNKRQTPMDLLKSASYGGIGGTGGSMAKTVTSTDTQYTVTNATTAKQLAQAALTQRLGRTASDAEVSEFVKALRAEEKKNPAVQNMTTTTNADGTSQTSTSTVKKGVDVQAFTEQYSLGYDSAEAEAFQTAGMMMPWFFEALRAPA